MPFGDEILILDGTTPAESRLLGSGAAQRTGDSAASTWPRSMDETNDEPGFFTALFTMDDPVQKRPLLVLGRRQSRSGRASSSFRSARRCSCTDAQSFALGADRKHGYILVQSVGVRRYELWTIDMTRQAASRAKSSSTPVRAWRCARAPTARFSTSTRPAIPSISTTRRSSGSISDHHPRRRHDAQHLPRRCPARGQVRPPATPQP